MQMVASGGFLPPEKRSTIKPSILALKKIANSFEYNACTFAEWGLSQISTFLNIWT